MKSCVYVLLGGVISWQTEEIWPEGRLPGRLHSNTRVEEGHFVRDPGVYYRYRLPSEMTRHLLLLFKLNFNFFASVLESAI